MLFTDPVADGKSVSRLRHRAQMQGSHGSQYDD